MPTYHYTALAADGSTQRGVIEAGSSAEANQTLFGRGLMPTRIDEGRARSAHPGAGLQGLLHRVKPIDLILFTKQLVTMVRVGIPITEALEILAQQSDHRRLKRVAAKLATEIQGGATLSSALAGFPDIFSELYRSVVEAGERSGTLAQVMDRLLYLIQHEARISAEVSAALRYPLMVLAALAGAFVVLLGFVIPRFVGFFSGAGLELPLPTVICLAMSDHLLSVGPAYLVALVVLAVLYQRAMRTDSGRRTRDELLLRTPILGPVLIKAAMSRFASIFAILQASGVLVLDALQILSRTVGNAAIAAQFEQIQQRLEEGHGISQPLRAARFFPPMLVNMVAIGEESGRLDELLREISSHYDSEVEATIKKMTDLIGPVLIVCLTGIVGFFALAIYMPMWDLTQMATQKSR